MYYTPFIPPVSRMGENNVNKEASQCLPLCNTGFIFTERQI